MTTKKKFIRMAMKMRPTAKEWRQIVEKAIASGCLPFEEMNGDFRDVYPLAGAILEQYAYRYINGSCNESVNRRNRREANNIKCFI